MSKYTPNSAADDTGPHKGRSRYRKIEVRMWGDEKFCSLSPLQPSGQALWIFLLTGPHTGPIPGLFRSGRAAMAEDLGWSVEAFEEAFREAFREGIAEADWKAKVVWIPNAIRCNKPESPNVIKSWSAEWDLVPECDLKRDAYESLRASIGGLGEAYAKAFEKAIAKPSPKPSAEPSPKPCRKPCRNQEQEQEQEGYMSGRPDVAASKPEKQTAAAVEVIGHLNARAKRSYRPVASNAKLIQARLQEGATVDQIKAVIDAKVDEWANDPKMAQYLRPETLFGATKFEQYLGQLSASCATADDTWTRGAL